MLKQNESQNDPMSETPVAASVPNIGAQSSESVPNAPVVEAAPQPAKRNFVKQIIFSVLALVFLKMAFGKTDFNELWSNVQHLDMTFVVAVAVCAIFSHWLRAVRWVVMLQPLKSEKISWWNAFCAVMVSYAVNIAVPRGGEVARVVSISKSEKLPWLGVLPTMFIDRLLDLALLVLLVGVTLVMLPPDIKSHVGWLVPVGGAMCASTFIGLMLLPKAGVILRAITEFPAVKSKLPEKVAAMTGKIATEFEQGTKSLSNPSGLAAIAGLSVAIWAAYWANLYLMLCAFGLQKQVDISRSLMVFTIGSIGVVVPTPGAVGTYHYAVSQALNMVAGVPPAQALAFVTVLHALSFVVVVCLVAAVCFIIQQASSRKQG